MKKSRYVLLMTGLFSIATAFTSLAGQWVQEGDRWRYQEYDGTYAKASTSKTGSYYIDSDNDGFAELYHFDKSGYLLTNTNIIVGSSIIYNIDGNGKSISPTSGELITCKLPQGTVNPDIWNGLLKPEFSNLLMNDIETVDKNFGTKAEERTLFEEYGFLAITPCYNSDKNVAAYLELANNKVVEMSGPCDYMFVNPSLSVAEINEIIGVEATTEKYFYGDYIFYKWELQGQPNITMCMYPDKENNSLEFRKISISIN